MKAKNNIYDIIREKGESLKGNLLFKSIVKYNTGKPLEYWLEKAKEK